jgi:DNA-binding response OmpR family regulator
LAEQKKIEFTFEAPSNPIFIYIDHDKLEKIICNLLSNALKFTNIGGKITVTISETDNTTNISQKSVKISVADTGIGIPPDKLYKIFNRFYQIDDTSNRQFEGSGIGLALTKELVELHRGKIFVESTPGKGTVFTLFLPYDKAAYNSNEIREITSETAAPGEEKTDVQSLIPEPAPVSDTHSPQKVDESKPILLIVEDNPDVIEYIRHSLDDHYRTIEAKDGCEGLDVAANTIPDLIISDVMMPNMDGFQFCEKVKTNERTSHIPVILLTARAGEASKIEGLETGADDYITKPFSIHELSIRAKNLIEQRKKLREYFSQHTIKIREPEEMIKRSVDRQFLKRIISIIEQNLSDSAFGTPNLAREIGLSRSQLYRKLYAITNYAPNEFIRLLRLRRAEQLLRNKTGNVTEVAYEVGFNHISYFAKCFQQTFGYTPSEYIHRKN